ncbi:hypothetical protein RRF57_003184 [Xylaria bambusicola]|uniref:Uncharacterized protein n=1 Tax=Xylaria bambusicola TaxID=326684 RepID=A0AAN7UTW3_9PEZI
MRILCDIGVVIRDDVFRQNIRQLVVQAGQIRVMLIRDALGKSSGTSATIDRFVLDSDVSARHLREWDIAMLAHSD